MLRVRKVLGVAVLAVLAVLLVAAPGLAHTELTGSDPAPGAEVTALDEVRLTFSRPVALLEDTVVVEGPDGDRVGAVASRAEGGTVVLATLEEPLDAGSWRIDWRVLAEDSHPRTGSVEVTVAGATRGGGASDASASPSPDVSAGAEELQAPATDGAPTGSAPSGSATPGSTGRGLERAGSVARVLFYGGLLVAAGLALFKAGPHAGQSARSRRLAGIAFLGAVVGVVAGGAEVALHVAAVSGRGVAGVVHGPTWRAVLGGTGFGPALLLRTVGLTLLAVGALGRLRAGLPSGPDWRKLLGALLAITSFQFIGHTASKAPELVVRSADLVHAVAAAVWVGGLVGLTVTARMQSPVDRSTTVARFSTWATGAVAGVTAAGVALTWVNLPTVASSWQTGYGRLLLAKLGLVAVLLALGTHNHFRVVPGVTAGDPGAAATLRRLVRWELAIVSVVVALTALLVSTSPV